MGHLIGHGESHTHSHAAGRVTAGIIRGRFHGVGRLKLGVLLKIPDDAHARALVEHFFHRRGQGNILDQEAGHIEPIGFEIGVESLGGKAAKLVVVRRQIEGRNLALGHQVAEAGYNQIAQLGRYLFRGEGAIHDFLDESHGVRYAHAIGAKHAQAQGPKLGIPQHNRILGAPFQIGDAAGADEIDLGLEGTFKTVAPRFQRADDGQVLRVEGVHARVEDVGNLALADKDRHLPLAHRELGAVLDLVAVPFKTMDHRVAGRIQPLDNVDEFSAKFVPDSHGAFLIDEATPNGAVNRQLVQSVYKSPQEEVQRRGSWYSRPCEKSVGRATCWSDSGKTGH